LIIGFEINNRNHMRVHTYDVPTAVIKAGKKAMCGTFVSADVLRACIAAGAPESVQWGAQHWQSGYVAFRIADRLLRAAKRDGKIVFNRGKWHCL
jgi:hypothetical protein